MVKGVHYHCLARKSFLIGQKERDSRELFGVREHLGAGLTTVSISDSPWVPVSEGKEHYHRLQTGEPLTPRPQKSSLLHFRHTSSILARDTVRKRAFYEPGTVHVRVQSLNTQPSNVNHGPSVGWAWAPHLPF